MTYDSDVELVIVSGNTDDPNCPPGSNDYHHYCMGAVVHVVRYDHGDGTYMVAPVDPGKHNWWGEDDYGEQWVEEQHLALRVTIDLSDPAIVEKFLSDPSATLNP